MCPYSINIKSGRLRNTVRCRGGPAAVTGDESCIATVRHKPFGKDRWRTTREPEDGRADRGQAHGNGRPCCFLVAGFLFSRRQEGIEITEACVSEDARH